MFKPLLYRSPDAVYTFEMAYEGWVKFRNKKGKIWRHLPRKIENLLEIDKVSAIDGGGRLPIWLYTMFWDQSNAMSPEEIRVQNMRQFKRFKINEGLTSDNLRLKTIAFFQLAYSLQDLNFDFIRFMKTMDEIMIDEGGELLIKLKVHDEEAPSVALIYEEKCFNMLDLVRLRVNGVFYNRMIKVICMVLHYITDVPKVWKKTLTKLMNVLRNEIPECDKGTKIQQAKYIK
jgi:hypothetical protein